MIKILCDKCEKPVDNSIVFQLPRNIRIYCRGGNGNPVLTTFPSRKVLDTHLCNECAEQIAHWLPEVYNDD